MDTIVKKRRGRKPKAAGPKLYFNEAQFKTEVLPKIQNNGNIPNIFALDIFSITDGMINTEFRNNTFVLEHRDDLKQECFYEVLKSLKKFDANRGRAFAYFNRIIKNTLLKWYYKNNKIIANEVKIVDLVSDYDGLENSNLDDALSLLSSKIQIQDEIKIQNSDNFNYTFDTNFSKMHRREKKGQSYYNVEYAVNAYLSRALNIIDEILKDAAILDKFKYFIRYDTTNENSIDIDAENIENLLKEIKYLFTQCVNKINEKMIANPQAYNFSNTDTILLSGRILIYIKNKISDKSLRKKCTNITKSPRACASIIMLLISFFDSLQKSA